MKLSSSKIKKIPIFHEMKLSAWNVFKNLLYFFKKGFSYLSRNATFLKKASYIPGDNFLSSKKPALKNVLYFLEKRFSYVSGNVTFLYSGKYNFFEKNFPSSKIRK